MASTYLTRTCKPWLRSDRDTWRVNESPREARESFASRLKPWVRFRPRMFFFFFSKNEEEAILPPLRPSSKLGSWGTNKTYYIGIPIQQVKNKIKPLHDI